MMMWSYEPILCFANRPRMADAEGNTQSPFPSRVRCFDYPGEMIFRSESHDVRLIFTNYIQLFSVPIWLLANLLNLSFCCKAASVSKATIYDLCISIGLLYLSL